MKERPILFKDKMVRAILDGRKTQTRRFHDRWQVGDHLWVREPYATDIPGCPGGVSYRADHRTESDGPTPNKWRTPMFMPRALSRITLEVVDKWPEEVRHITDTDAKAEGVYYDAAQDGWQCAPDALTHQCPRYAFTDLWDSIHGDDPNKCWAADPLVVAYVFRVVEAKS